jgi:hypothetical protein
MTIHTALRPIASGAPDAQFKILNPGMVTAAV